MSMYHLPALLVAWFAAALLASILPSCRAGDAGLPKIAVPAEHLAPGAPVKLTQDQQERLILICGKAQKSVSLLQGDKFVALAAEPVADAAASRDGKVFLTQGEDVYEVDVAKPGQKEKVTAAFGGAPSGGKTVSCTPDGTVWVEGCPKRRLPNGTFAATPPSPVAGVGCVPLTLDTCGNFWALVPEAAGAANRQLFVLPAQKPTAWIPAADPAVKAGPWHSVIAADEEEVWVAAPKAIRCLNLRKPEEGWTFADGDGLPGAEITALGLAPSGHLLVGFGCGAYAECYREKDGKKAVQVLPPPEDGAVRAVFTDTAGSTWVLTGTNLWRVPPAPDAWQKNWRAVACLPYGDHDIFGAELGGKLYAAGGAVKANGYPAEERVFDDLWVYDPAKDGWALAAKLKRPRLFNGLAAFEGKLWIVGGTVLEKDGKRVATGSIEVYDPKTNTVEAGPDLKTARPSPLAAVAGGRLYVVGDSPAVKAGGPPMESLGAGEKAWRDEPAAPGKLGVLAGCALDQKLFVRPNGPGFYIFDAQAGKWDTAAPAPPQPARSPQMAAAAGTVWMIGGRGLKRSRETFFLNVAARKWQEGPDLPRERAWGACAVLGGKLFIAGGAFDRGGNNFIFSNCCFMLRVP